MNRSNWDTPAGRPRDINDPFTWGQEGIEEAFKGMFSFLGLTAPEGVVLSGCVVTTPAAATPGDANSADITEGFIYLEGEVLHVPAATTLTKGAGDNWVFDLDDTGNGVPLAYAGGSVEIMRERKGVLRGEPTSTSANYMPVNADTWLLAVHGKWAKETFAGRITAAGGLTETGTSITSRYNKLTGMLDLQYWATSISVAGTPSTISLSLAGYNGLNFACAHPTNMQFGVMIGNELCRANVTLGGTSISITKAAGGSFSTGSLGPFYAAVALPVTPV